MINQEIKLVEAIVTSLKRLGYRVETEIANFHRSADIAAIDNDGFIWIIECKVSNMNRAIIQSKTHKLSADKVFIGTCHRNTKKNTLKKIREEGIGLIYVMPDGNINIAIEETTKGKPWRPARERLLKRIMEANR